MELPMLRAVADNHQVRHDEHAAELAKLNDGLANALARVNQQLAELTTRAETESAARRALKGEIEETVAATTAQVRTLASEQTEVSKQQRETMDRFVQEHTTRMATTNTSHQQQLQKAIVTQKEDLSSRLDTLEKAQKELAQRETPAPVVQERVVTQESVPDKKHDDLAKQVRELQRRVPEKTVASETIVYPHEDHILYLQDSLQEFCERFIGGLERRRTTLTSRAVVVQSEGMMESSMEFEARAEGATGVQGEVVFETSAESAAQME